MDPPYFAANNTSKAFSRNKSTSGLPFTFGISQLRKHGSGIQKQKPSLSAFRTRSISSFDTNAENEVTTGQPSPAMENSTIEEGFDGRDPWSAPPPQHSAEATHEARIIASELAEEPLQRHAPPEGGGLLRSASDQVVLPAMGNATPLQARGNAESQWQEVPVAHVQSVTDTHSSFKGGFGDEFQKSGIQQLPQTNLSTEAAYPSPKRSPQKLLLVNSGQPAADTPTRGSRPPTGETSVITLGQKTALPSMAGDVENDLAVVMMSIAERMHQTNEDRQKEVHRLVEELDNAHAVIEEQGSTINKLDENCRMIIQSISAQGDKLDNNRLRIDKLKQACKLYSLTIQRLDKLIKDADVEKNILIRNLDLLKRDHDGSEEKYRILLKDKKEAEARASEMHEALSRQLQLVVVEKEQLLQRLQETASQADDIGKQLSQARKQYLDELAFHKLEASKDLDRAHNATEALRQELHSMQVEKQVLFEQNRQAAADAQDQISKLESTVRRLQVDGEDLEASKTRLKRELDDLSLRLSASEQETRQMRARYEQQATDLDAARARMEQREAEWESIRQLLTTELESVRNRSSIWLSTQDRDAKARQHQLEDDCDRLQREVSTLQEVKSSLTVRSEDASAALAALSESQRKEIGLLAERNAALQASLSAEQAARADEQHQHTASLTDATRRANERYAEIRREFDSKLAEANQVIEELQAKLEANMRAHQRQAEEHVQDSTRLQTKCRMLEKDHEEAETKFKKRLQEVQRALEDAQLRVDGAMQKAKHYEDMYKELSDLTPNHAAVVKRACDFEAALVTAEAAKELAVSRSSKLEASLQQLKDENSALQARLLSSEQTMGHETRNLAAEIVGLKSSLTQARKERDDLEQRSVQLRQERDDAQNQAKLNLTEMKKLYELKVAELETTLSSLDKTRREKTDLQVSMTKLEKAHEDSERNMHATIVEKDGALHKAHELDASLERAIAEIKSLKAQLEDYAVDRDISSQQIRSLKENLATNTALAEDNLRLRERCAALEFEVKNLREAQLVAAPLRTPEENQPAAAITATTPRSSGKNQAAPPATTSSELLNKDQPIPIASAPAASATPRKSPTTPLHVTATLRSENEVTPRIVRDNQKPPVPGFDTSGQRQQTPRGTSSREPTQTPLTRSTDTYNNGATSASRRTDASRQTAGHHREQLSSGPAVEEDLSDPPAFSQIENTHEGGSDESDPSETFQELLEAVGNASPVKPRRSSRRQTSGKRAADHVRTQDLRREATPPIATSKSRKRVQSTQQEEHNGGSARRRKDTQQKATQEMWSIPEAETDGVEEPNRRAPRSSRGARSSLTQTRRRGTARREASPPPTRANQARVNQAPVWEEDLGPDSSLELRKRSRDRRSDDDDYEPTPVRRQNERTYKKVLQRFVAARTEASTPSKNAATSKRANATAERTQALRSQGNHRSPRDASVHQESRTALRRKNTGYTGYAPQFAPLVPRGHANQAKAPRRALSTTDVQTDQSMDERAMFEEQWSSRR
ncbi:hypothetical protein HK097_006491 [Rhizophlyctis rosea]|uniref:Uncharacterized protein n=1 Tax=Rhizophlyctis rosea TaxID=64517 RepID=A0AAD5SKM6_9FUNG|nr:hypothetical protein HK097_006491 [Rhizophlyctis rosea]